MTEKRARRGLYDLYDLAMEAMEGQTYGPPVPPNRPAPGASGADHSLPLRKGFGMAQVIRNNPCETHFNVRADGFCPVCLVEERDRLRTENEQLKEAVHMAYEAAKGATREAIAQYVESQVKIVEFWQSPAWPIDTVKGLRFMAEAIRNGEYSK
jgi:hypothetical protein